MKIRRMPFEKYSIICYDLTPEDDFELTEWLMGSVKGKYLYQSGIISFKLEEDFTFFMLRWG